MAKTAPVTHTVTAPRLSRPPMLAWDACLVIVAVLGGIPLACMVTALQAGDTTSLMAIMAMQGLVSTGWLWVRFCTHPE